MKRDFKRFALVLCVALVLPSAALGYEDGIETIALITDFSYKAAPGDSKKTYQALALFRAKFKAVETAAKYFTHKGLLEHYGNRQNEIFCLATDEIDASIIDENYFEEKEVYTVKIRSKVRVTDFIRAEIKNLEMERIEYGFSYDEEMEQYVSESIDPGKELSRAYRYIRQGQWRIAVIYLNHLGSKYPHWGDVCLAKAIGYYSLHDMDKMIAALKTACSLGYPEACQELRSLAEEQN